MQKTVKALSALAVTLGVFTLSMTAMPAYADDAYAAGAASGLQNSPVYVEGTVGLTDSGQLANAVSGSDVGIAVLPPVGLDPYSPTDMANIIRSQTGGEYSTIIVVVDQSGKDTFAVSSVNNTTEIATTINEALTASNGDAGAALSSTIEEVKVLSDSATAPGPVNPGTTGNSGGFDGGFLIPVILVVAAAAAGVSFFVRSRTKKRDSRAITEKKEQIPTRFSDRIPAKLQPFMKQLSDLAKAHAELAQNSLTDTLKDIISNLEELFERLSTKGTDSQRKMVEVEYADKLPKLIEALGKDYYLDIVQKRKLWDNPDERIAEVANVTTAVDEQLVENIKQVNASKDLEFKVAMVSLGGKAKGTTLKEIYNTPDEPKRKGY